MQLIFGLMNYFDTSAGGGLIGQIPTHDQYEVWHSHRELRL